jgi:UDPglucose 6-dehydrogenase
LEAGLGYGGSCFRKDVRALAHMASEAGIHPELLETVMKINQNQRHFVLDKLELELGGPGSLRDKSIAVLGLAFKDNTDDMRDAPALDLVNWLIEAGAHVRAFDPVAMERARQVLPDHGITYCQDAYDAVRDSDGVLIVTEWKCFRELNLSRVRDAMRPREGGRAFIDGRNLFNPTEMTQMGFRYHGIGRGVERRNNDSKYLVGKPADGLVKHTASDGACIR